MILKDQKGQQPSQSKSELSSGIKRKRAKNGNNHPGSK